MNRRRVVRNALLAVVLAAGVIVGLLGMHGFDTHGSMSHGSVAHSSVSASAHEMDAAPEVTVDNQTSAATGVACVLALLAGILLLSTPRRGMLPPELTTSLQQSWVLLRTARPSRPPSLVVLCISRT